MKQRSSESLKSFILLFFSFTFANSVTVAIHEVGHALAIWAGGVKDVKIILHPYLSSRVIWNPIPELLGIVDAAGPLFNIIVSTIILLVLWKFRKPILMPFLLMAPLSYFQEGFSSFMQIVLNQAGTDSIRIIQSGVPMIVVLVISIILLLLGIFLFVAFLPMFGIRKTYSFGRVYTIIFSATGLNMVIIFIFGLWKDVGERLRALILLAGMLLFSLIFAGLHKTIFKRRAVLGIKHYKTTTTDILVTLLTALVPVALGIIFLR